jgi:hypothetical protein
MGGTPFPTELLNPAPRAAVLGALSHPHLYARAASTVQNKREQDVGRVKLADLPDTAIAFRRYLDAGKMVNVHDWFESFKLVLDAQRPNDVREVRLLALYRAFVADKFRPGRRGMAPGGAGAFHAFAARARLGRIDQAHEPETRSCNKDGLGASRVNVYTMSLC